FFLSVMVLLALKKSILALVRSYIAGRKRLSWAESLMDALSPALTVAIVSVGLAIVDRILPLTPKSDRMFDFPVPAGFILGLISFADRIGRHLIDRLALRSLAVEGAQGLIQGGVRGVIIGLGVLIFLDSVGISITPLIASLGVGTLAVALALQDTLANLFAGIYLIAEKPVEAGHFVKLESGEQGHVTRVGWRNTH